MGGPVPAPPPPNAAPRGPDAGSTRFATVGIVLAIVLTLGAFVMQQSVRLVAVYAPPPAPDPLAPAEAPAFDVFTLMSKMMVKIDPIVGDAGDPAATMAELDPWAVSNAEQVRLAIVAGEIEGVEAAMQRLDPLGVVVEGPLREDISRFREVYRAGSESVDATDRAELIERHGWFASLALAWDQPDSDPGRARVLRNGIPLMLLLVGFLLVLIGFAVASMTFFVLAVVWLSAGKLRLNGPTPGRGGSVYIETYCLFLVAFLLVMLAGLGVQATGMGGSDLSIYLPLLLIWLVVPVLGWPLVRGVSWERYRGEMGLHRGAGVFREVGCGIATYFAALPVYAVLFLIGFVIEAVLSSFQPAPAMNESFLDLPANPALAMVLFFLLLTVWAPVVEEIVFRGALFRHLSGLAAWPVAALVSAIAFGVVHPYGLGLLLPVGALGFVFALMRRWRGSLIAPMTAHALHNGTIGLLLVSLVMLLRD